MSINNNNDNLTEEDKDFFRTSEKFIESVINHAKLENSLGMMTEDKKKNINNLLAQALIPPSIRNTTRSDLKEIMVNSYIQESMLVMREKAREKRRTCLFHIKKDDLDLLEELSKTWNSRTIGVSGVNDKKEVLGSDNEIYIELTLSW